MLKFIHLFLCNDGRRRRHCLCLFVRLLCDCELEICCNGKLITSNGRERSENRSAFPLTSSQRTDNCVKCWLLERSESKRELDCEWGDNFNSHCSRSTSLATPRQTRRTSWKWTWTWSEKSFVEVSIPSHQRLRSYIIHCHKVSLSSMSQWLISLPLARWLRLGYVCARATCE